MAQKMTGALVFDERTDRYDIRFDLASYYGGLHCGDCFDVFTRGKWKPTRIEMNMAQEWYLVGIRADDLNGLRVHDFIMTLPKGYDTPVGELGDTLSGGERQRLGLARAFLHDAPLMLLDEPTSNLDSLNEAVILKSLGQEGGGKTVVLVSHRQSTMRIVDQVYSVENGRLS